MTAKTGTVPRVLALRGTVPAFAPARAPNPPNHTLVLGNWNLAATPQLSPSKCISLFVRKHRRTYRQLRTRLRRQLRRQLNPALNLKLDLDIIPSLNRALFAALYGKSHPSLFASLSDALYRKKHRPFDAPIYLQLHRQLQLPRRPGGRGVGGRIVAPAPGRYHTLWCRHRPVRLRPYDKDSYHARLLVRLCNLSNLKLLHSDASE
jgi:hypothetical protein